MIISQNSVTDYKYVLATTSNLPIINNNNIILVSPHEMNY